MTRFRWLTALTVVSVWVLVAVGGVVRGTGSGLGCPNWPLCTSRALPLGNIRSVIEYSHRVIVVWVSLLVVAVAVLAWRGQRQNRLAVVAAFIAVAMLPVQALLGAIAVWWDLAGAMVAVHFLVGMTFLAVTVIAAIAAWFPSGIRAAAGFVWTARIGALTGAGLVGLGAAVVATGADTACGTQWPACNGGFATGGGAAVLQVTHRTVAYAVAVIAVLALVLALRRHRLRVLAALPVAAVLVQIGMGVGVVMAGANPDAYAGFAAAHVAGAGLVWALLAGLATVLRVRQPHREEVVTRRVRVSANRAS